MGEAKRRKESGNYPVKTDKPRMPPGQARPAVSWEVVGDEDSHPKTAQVLAQLQQLKGDYPGLGGGNLMVIQFESAPQVPVIVVRTMGLDVYLKAVTMFQELDMEDRLLDLDSTERSVDAAFS